MSDIIYFRGKPLINRNKEMNFIKEYFSKLPDRILWIYGPKSTGKTTLIEYIVENELFEDFTHFKSSKYSVKYINFRRKTIGNYDSFIDAMLEEDSEEYERSSEINRAYNLLGVFKLDAKILTKYKQNKKNLPY